MRIISWNVNGIRATSNKGELARILAEQDPDILFMQEIKATPDKLTEELLSPLPYIAYYNPAEKPGYAGTGAWVHSRLFEEYDIEWRASFPGDPTANEGRVAHVILKKKDIAFAHCEEGSVPTFRHPEVSGAQDLPQESRFRAEVPRNDGNIDSPVDINTIIDIFGIYFPNGGKSDQAWQDKLVFYREFGAYMDTLRDTGHMVLWGGDLNCAHHPIDLARPKENDGKIGFHPLERAWLDERTTDDWHDIWRERNPNVIDVYSWWDVITRSRARNVGWRIDAWWGSAPIYERTRDTYYLGEQMGSDHCPMTIDLDI